MSPFSLEHIRRCSGTTEGKSLGKRGREQAFVLQDSSSHAPEGSGTPVPSRCIAPCLEAGPWGGDPAGDPARAQVKGSPSKEERSPIRTYLRPSRERPIFLSCPLPSLLAGLISSRGDCTGPPGAGWQLLGPVPGTESQSAAHLLLLHCGWPGGRRTRLPHSLPTAPKPQPPQP